MSIKKKKNYRMAYDSSCSKIFIKKLNDQYNGVKPRNFGTYTIMDKNILQNLTIKRLKQISRENKVNIKGKYKKQEIINLLWSFFRKKNRRSKMNLLSVNFEIRTDSEGYFAVSQWFKESKVVLGNNRLRQCLNSKKFILVMIEMCENFHLKQMIRKVEGIVYVHRRLVLMLAAYLSDDLFEKVYLYLKKLR